MQIRWLNEASNQVHALYCYEHGVRLDTTPSPIKRIDRFLQERRVLVANTRADLAARGLGVTMPGTDACLCLVGVPIVAGDRVLGSILLENHERESAFGEAEVRLLSTVAASMGVALENARLFDETQRLLKETEQRAAELAIINRIQEGIAAELDFQAIIDLVGNALRDVLKCDNLGITWHDAKANLIHYLYSVERGRHLLSHGAAHAHAQRSVHAHAAHAPSAGLQQPAGDRRRRICRRARFGGQIAFAGRRPHSRRRSLSRAS